jgi:hypothetical protein
MPSRRRRVRAGFALCAVLAILILFVIDGAAGGALALVTMLLFIAVCVTALRGEDPETIKKNERTGLAGWFGGFF